MNIIIAILIFSVIILFHELGHFALAKKNGVRVNEFALGMGPTIIGFTKGETKYCVKLFPFGGSCMMEGEDEESEVEGSFNSKSIWARISVIAAGPVFNFIMAFVFALILIGVNGYDEPVITGVTEGYAAAEAGLQEGDTIVELNGKKIHFYREVAFMNYYHQGMAWDVVYERDGETYSAYLEPKYDEEMDRDIIGVQYSYNSVKTNFLTTIQYGFYEMKYLISSTVQSVGMLITGKVSFNELSGPVGIVKNIGDTYTQSKAVSVYSVVMNMLNWAALLSANLGVMNLLPIPALDGGRLVFLILEAIRGKKVSQSKEGMVHFVGIVFLMGLMVVIMFNDIRKLF